MTDYKTCSKIFCAALFLLGEYAEAYTRFQYQLDGSIRNYNVQWLFIDLFDTSASKISTFRNQGKKVICYFSAGTAENWRSDYGKFTSSVKGRSVDGWAGEKWVNVKSSTVVSIMKARMDMAKNKGCDGVDPDNVDGFDNDTGFSISANDSKNFLKTLASEAHARGLLVGLKNGAEIASSLAGTMNFAVVEECFQYNECSSYSSFVSKGKPVFLIEYSSGSRSLCNKADNMGMSLEFYNEDLNGSFKVCH